MALFRPAEVHTSVSIRSPPAAATKDKGVRESARKRESRSRREKPVRDSRANGDSRSHHRLSNEKDQRRGHREVRREESPRNLYLSEKEYRTYGLRGERGNLTPPSHIPDPTLETHRRDYEREQLLRHPNLVLRDPAHRETVRADPLYLSEREYLAYGLGGRRELPPSVPAPGLDPYAKDPHYAYYYSGSSVDPYLPPQRRDEIPPVDPYLPPYRREDVPSASYSVGGRREPYVIDGVDPVRRRDIEHLDRLYSTYPSDSLSGYSQAYHTRHEAAALPAASRYYAGSSFSYR